MRKRLSRLDKLLIGGILLGWGLSGSESNLLVTVSCVSAGAVLLVLAFLPLYRAEARAAEGLDSDLSPSGEHTDMPPDQQERTPEQE